MPGYFLPFLAAAFLGAALAAAAFLGALAPFFAAGAALAAGAFFLSPPFGIVNS